jgi:hypothetical protein
VISRLARPAFLIPVIVLIVILMGAWLWVRAGSSTQVSGGQALRDYGDAASRATKGPLPGVWTYRLAGDETVGLGPLRVDRTFPPEAQVVVRRALSGYWRTLVFSEEHIEASRLRVTPRGQYLDERVTTVKVAGIGREDAKRLVPPPLTLPNPIRVGMTWPERYALDDVRVNARARVLRRQRVQVGDRNVEAFVIRVVAHITGPLPGARTDEVWWSPALSMPVRWGIDMDITGTASLRMRADLTLAAPAPSTERPDG